MNKYIGLFLDFSLVPLISSSSHVPVSPCSKYSRLYSSMYLGNSSLILFLQKCFNLAHLIFQINVKIIVPISTKNYIRIFS